MRLVCAVAGCAAGNRPLGPVHVCLLCRIYALGLLRRVRLRLPDLLGLVRTLVGMPCSAGPILLESPGLLVPM